MRSEEPTLEQLMASTRTFERRARPERGQLRKRVASRLAAAGVGLTHSALAAGSSSGAVAWLTAVKFKILVGTVVLGGAALGGHALIGAKAPGPAQLVTGDGGGRGRALCWQHVTGVERAASLKVLRLPSPEIKLPSALGVRGPKPSGDVAKDSLADELQLLRAAQGALAKGAPHQGLELLGQYFQRFPSGILQPEAKVTRVRALCQAGRRGESQREAEQFSHSYPDSPLAKQLRPCKAP